MQNLRSKAKSRVERQCRRRTRARYLTDHGTHANHTNFWSKVVLAAVIPDLRVFVFPGAIYLDYRMGPDWGPAQLCALFELLNQLKLLDKAAVITLPEECMIPRYRAG